MQPPPTIICVDCGGTCHLLTSSDRDVERDADQDAEGWGAGGDHELIETEVVAAYRCVDCLDRWDVIFDGSDDDGSGDDGSGDSL